YFDVVAIEILTDSRFLRNGMLGKVFILLKSSHIRDSDEREIPEMEDKKAPIMDKVHPDLLAPPHIVNKLFHLVTGEWQPDPSQQEQLVVHLTECPYCRTSLIVLLSADQEYESLNTSPETPVHNLLTRFVAIHHEIE